MDRRTVGVEEEFLLVDPQNGAARALAATVLGRDSGDSGDLTAELQREQLETTTRPCRELSELGREIRRTRTHARTAARAGGAAAAALGTYPRAVEPTLYPSPRYRRMLDRFGLTGREQLTCGCHVHVSVGEDEEAVGVLDRIRPWLAPLLALSVNSPFWTDTDSGYASFRTQVWSRWPSAGPYGRFGSAAGYRTRTAAMLATDTLLDEGMLYFDARLCRRYRTVEIRVADVCRDPDDAVLIAALGRALVETAAREWRAGIAPDPVHTEILRLAAWRASRSGLAGPLLDPATWRPAPADAVITRLVERVSAALSDAGDLATVEQLLAGLRSRGTGADRQRAVYDHSGDLRAVILDAIIQT